MCGCDLYTGNNGNRIWPPGLNKQCQVWAAVTKTLDLRLIVPQSLHSFFHESRQV